MPPRRRQHTSVRFNAKTPANPTGRKAEFVERDATGVTAQQDIERVRRFR
jgi:hypothetical protein